jgi:hypothetical protein
MPVYGGRERNPLSIALSLPQGSGTMRWGTMVPDDALVLDVKRLFYIGIARNIAHLFIAVHVT